MTEQDEIFTQKLLTALILYFYNSQISREKIFSREIDTTITNVHSLVGPSGGKTHQPLRIKPI